MEHEIFMQKALSMAHEAALRDEVPVGAILIKDGQIYSAQNAREHAQNPLGHAEVLAVLHACETLNTWRLDGATLYVTVEPCLMCTGVLYQTRVSKVVFGCKNPKGGSLEYVSIREKDLRLNHTLEIVGGVLEAQCSAAMSSFFMNKRKQVL